MISKKDLEKLAKHYGLSTVTSGQLKLEYTEADGLRLWSGDHCCWAFRPNGEILNRPGEGLWRLLTPKQADKFLAEAGVTKSCPQTGEQCQAGGFDCPDGECALTRIHDRYNSPLY